LLQRSASRRKVSIGLQRWELVGKEGRGRTIHVVCFGGLDSEGGSQVAGRRRREWEEAVPGEREVLAASSMVVVEEGRW
jgi:hypothetical protein